MTDWILLDGRKVRRARKRAHYRQADVSARIARLGIGYGFSTASISRVETGHDGGVARYVTELQATVLAAALGQPLSAILVPGEPDDLPERAERAIKLLGDAQALLRGDDQDQEEER
jgi:transcriptional regulator with XRE-family HTH domain